MKRLVVAALAIAALVGAPPAAAKSCIRIQAPAVADVGETVRIVVRVYLPTWRQGRVVKLTPMPNWGGRLKLRATTPTGGLKVLKTEGARDGVGVVRVAFARAGRWRLDAVGWEYAPPTCAPPRFIRVS
jgi:hypothetical protein